MTKRFILVFCVVLMLGAACAVQAADILQAATEGNLAAVKALLKADPKLIDAKDADGWTPLHLAMANDERDLAKWLILNGANVNAKTSDGATPLHLLLDEDLYMDIAKLLVSRGADVNARNTGGETPLTMAACGNQRSYCTLYLANGARIDIFAAAYLGDQRQVKELLKSDPGLASAKVKDGITPLSLAAREGNEGMVKLLIASGAHVDDGRSLREAADCHNPTLVKLLIDHGAKADLETAVKLGDIAQIRRLLSEDSKVTRKKLVGDGSLMLTAIELGHRDVVVLLLSLGAPVNGAGNGLLTPLQVAAKSTRKSIAELLLDKGADIGARDRTNRTALHYAAGSGDQSIAALLIARGAKVNVRDNDGITPLHAAAWNGYTAVAELLLANGAGINARTNKGASPLDLALADGRAEAAAMLRKHGGRSGLPVRPKKTAAGNHKTSRAESD